jgi:hypothetical protein
MMAEPYSGLGVEGVRERLAGLIAKGLTPNNIANKAGELLDLGIVTSRLRPAADAASEDERAYAPALVAVLKEAVTRDRMPKRGYRLILRCVLPLKDELVGKSVTERRTAAGEALLEEDGVVQPSTIRTYYEPRALDNLATVLVAMEAEHRGEDPPEQASSSS